MKPSPVSVERKKRRRSLLKHTKSELQELVRQKQRLQRRDAFQQQQQQQEERRAATLTSKAKKKLMDRLKRKGKTFSSTTPKLYRYRAIPESPNEEAYVAHGHAGDLFYQVRHVKDGRNTKRLRVDKHNFDLKFHMKDGTGEDQVQRLADSLKGLEDAVTEVQNYLVKEYEGQEHADLQLVVQHRDMDDPFSVKADKLDDPEIVKNLMYKLNDISQSKKDLSLDDRLTINAIVTNVPPLFPQGGVGMVGGLEAGEEDEEELADDGEEDYSEEEDDEDKEPAEEPIRSRRVRLNGRMVTLGPAFRDPGLRPKGNRKSTVKALPVFLDGPCKNKCILTHLVYGIYFNLDLEAKKGKKNYKGNPVAEVYKQLAQIFRKGKEWARGEAARARLEQEVVKLCREKGIDMTKFENAEPEDLREELDKFGINVNIYDANLGHNLVFAHPQQHDPKKQTVSLYLIKNPVTKLRHCVLIPRPDTFFASLPVKRTMCLHCRHSYTQKHFKYHKCRASVRCGMCHRRQLHKDDYDDYVVNKNCCRAGDDLEPGANVCVLCQRQCQSESCLKRHTTHCKKYTQCPTCHRRHRRDKEHRCGDRFCLCCKKEYNENDGPHYCQMEVPSEQKSWTLMAFWDTESFISRYVYFFSFSPL